MFHEVLPKKLHSTVHRKHMVNICPNVGPNHKTTPQQAQPRMNPKLHSFYMGFECPKLKRMTCIQSYVCVAKLSKSETLNHGFGTWIP